MPLTASFAFRAAGVLTVALLLGSCVASLPTPAYRRIDQSSPGFQEALALEKQRLVAEGRAASEAEKFALKNVRARFIGQEKERRAADVAPLVKALDAFDQSRGCWAYTVTTTERRDGQTTLTVESFDPFQPEERLWTLVRRNGAEPDAEAQADYRRRKLREWRKSRSADSSRDVKWVKHSSMHLGAEITEENAPPRTAFAFTRNKQTAPFLGDEAECIDRYVIDRASGALQHRSWKFTRGGALFGGLVKIEHYAKTTDFVVLDPALPPFLTRTTARYRLWRLGVDSGEIDTESVYSDYRRVKCYDERFEVKVGLPQMID